MMEYKGYLGKVEFDPDAKILHGEVLGIRDVITFQGDSVDEVDQAFRESVDDYLAFCKGRGEEPDKPFSGHFLLRVGPELHRVLNMLAQASGRSLNALAADYLSREATRHLPHTRTAPKTTSRRWRQRAAAVKATRTRA